MTIGRSFLRKEDRPLLTGAARFADDVRLPGALHATILRSPHGHVRIAGIDVRDAEALPSVVKVFTAADVPDGGGPAIPMRMFSHPGMERFLQRPLAREVARYSGEPVAVVVADSRYRAEDAAELVEVDYEPLPAVVDAARALEPDAPVLHEHAGTNLAAEYRIGHGDADAAFAAADVVVAARIGCQRHAAVPLETRGLLVDPCGKDGRPTIWGASKVPHVNRRMLAAMLGRDETDIRFVELSVGGGFGARGEFYPEDYLIPWCALALNRPIAWAEDREEHLRSTNHSREQAHDLELALAADGTFLAIRGTLLNNTGAYVRTHGTVVPGMTAGLLPGPYRLPAYRVVVRQVVTNKTPSGTYRAPGRYEATLARERLVDMAARELDRDPADLRRQNLVAPDEMPYAVGTELEGHPVVYDSGDYPRLLQAGLERFDYGGMRAWRDAGVGDPRVRRGVGIALFVEKSGIGVWEWGRASLARGGEIVVHTGAASLGQGLQTVLAQVCADRLGVDYARVRVELIDTDHVPDGMGSFGSRATALGGAAVARAAEALHDHLLDAAAEHLEAAVEDLVLSDAGVEVRGTPSARVSLVELAERNGDGLAGEGRYSSEDMSFPYGLHCAAVEVDVESGAVRIHRYAIAYDVGRSVNPMLVEGQIVGGLAQGAGGALFEHLAYDEQGQLVAGTFADLLLPTATEVPAVDVLVTEDAPSPLTPQGFKGAGEGGTNAAGAAIANAVSDALGAEVTDLPITPERALALAAAGGRR
ncbi:MAG: xanthine dehydrogenase family protein molybdopterin-binding subunit [Solirubrobacteraceae bacterium]